MKVLLLNIPGNRLFIRDYYCSKISKAYYITQPVDLVISSAFYRDQGWEIKFIDSIVNNISFQDTEKMILDYSPDIIQTMIGSVSYDSDVNFLRRIRSLLNKVKIFASGDGVLGQGKDLLSELKFLDGIITNFIYPGIVNYILGRYDKIQGLIYKLNNKLIIAPPVKNGEIEMPVPAVELFLNKNYRYPFVTAYPMGSTITNYGCPFLCEFCIMPKLGFIYRKPENVIEELREMKSLGMKYIFFADQTFYSVPAQTDKILDAMISEKMGFKWCTFSRVDRMTPNRLKKMKKAGCNVLMLGVEFSQDKYLKKYRKNYTREQIISSIKAAKKVGLKVLGTFLIGVPGQNEEEILETIDFAIELKLNYISINVAVPREDTIFREEALKMGIFDGHEKHMDQSGERVVMGTGKITAERVHKLKNLAYRRFYFRPAYILTALFNIRSFEELKSHFSEMMYIIKNFFK